MGRGQVGTCHVMTGEVKTGQDGTCHIKVGQVRAGQVRSEEVKTLHINKLQSGGLSRQVRPLHASLIRILWNLKFLWPTFFFWPKTFGPQFLGSPNIFWTQHVFVPKFSWPLILLDPKVFGPNHTCKKFLALLVACDEYSFSSDNFGIIFNQSEKNKCDKIGNNLSLSVKNMSNIK